MKILLSISAVLILGHLVSAQDILCPVVDCAPGTTFNCLIDPCSTASCPLYPEATCCSNYCGGCFTFWLTPNGEDVTDQCRLPPNGDCPAPSTDLVTTCVVTCTSDDDCSNSQLCCPGGCGTLCQDPVDPCATVRCANPDCPPGFTQVTPEGECCPVCRPTLVCPAPDATSDGSFSDMFGGTNICPPTCDDSQPCSSSLMCCNTTRCGNVCRAPVVSCFDEERDRRLRQGESYRVDDCTICECLRNGSFACRETCTRDCPEVDDDTGAIGTCANECSDSQPCPTGQFCCRNSCGGMVCRNPEVTCRRLNGESLSVGETFEDDCNTCTCGDDGSIQCTDNFCPEYGCPSMRDGDIPAGVSCLFNTSCGNRRSDSNECPDDQECCKLYAGCAPVCVEPVIVCVLENGAVLHVGQTYTSDRSCKACSCGNDGQLTCRETDCPGCTTADGAFYRVGTEVPSDDCNTCTCLEGAAGEDPSISCTEIACGDFCETPDGTLIPVGQTFNAPDGCNTCTCTASGFVACTLIFCPDRCFLPQQVGDCDAVVPRYWFDYTTGVCSLFNWGGCGGNRNRFETVEACLRACNRDSTCLASIYPEDEEPRCRIASQRRWTFNLTSAMCEQIEYIPCQSSEGFNVYETEEECNRRCIGGDTTGPECPPGVPIVLCVADPCQVNSCPNYPNARCEANFCGGCNAVFFDSDGTDITSKCTTVPTCDDGTPIVSCFANPCDVSSCPNFPEATCEENYCGGCNAWYFDSDRNNVTDRCRRTGSVLPTPLEFLQCPAVAEGTLGACVLSCNNHDDCDGDMLCCSNGCGQTCQDGDPIPYYQIPLSCPVVSTSDLFGLCVISNNSCLSDEECEDNERCCREGCGRVCKEASRPSAPCTAIVDSIYAALSATDLTGFVGMYIPQCLDDGSFAPVQCHGSTGYCWCVHTQTGQPLSSRAGRGVMPNCITCLSNNRTYYPGQSFPHTDGCNKCTCNENGFPSCSTRPCVEPTGCAAEPDPGPCRGAFPAYYYDPDDQTCKSFTYGGCGGNDNKFYSVRDCLRRCNSDSVCLLRPEQGPCDALGFPFFFNSSSGQCERFQYGGCQGNGNRFNSGEDCLESCNPDGEYEEGCLGIVCDVPICPPGSRLVTDDSTCCGYCSEIECEDDEKRCRDGSGCVSMDRICDIVEDCDDGSDERDCPDPTPDCRPGFLCGSQECIPERYVCDDYVDCRDRSDEQGCTPDLPPNTRYIRNIPRECPPQNNRLADCEDESCRGSGDCDNGELCCPTSCNTRMCVIGDPISPRCPALRRMLLTLVNTTLFIPDCERDGTFSPRQCHGGYCWCADIQSGFPLTEGARNEELTCSGCQLRDDDPSSVVPFGETYPDSDGCNVCFCTSDWPRVECTNNRCPGPCRINGEEVPHQGTFRDDCIECKCEFGALTCARRECTTAAPVRRPVRVTMPFDGDFDSIVSDSAKEEELKREVMRTLLSNYRESMKLNQDQITDVELRKGSVIVIVSLVDSENTTNANLTVLLSQLEQDYMSGIIVIRFDNGVLEPAGSFQVEEEPTAVALAPWVIAVIVVAGVAVLIAVVAIIIAVVACCLLKGRGGSGSKYQDASNNDYAASQGVSFSKNEDTIKVPLD